MAIYTLLTVGTYRKLYFAIKGESRMSVAYSHCKIQIIVELQKLIRKINVKIPFLSEWWRRLTTPQLCWLLKPWTANKFEHNKCLVGGLLVSILNYNAPIKYYRCPIKKIDSHAMSLVKCSLPYLYDSVCACQGFDKGVDTKTSKVPFTLRFNAISTCQFKDEQQLWWLNLGSFQGCVCYLNLIGR